MSLQRSRSLMFWMNSVGDIIPCHILRPSSINSLYLPLLLVRLHFPLVTMISNVSSHVIKEDCLPFFYKCLYCSTFLSFFHRKQSLFAALTVVDVRNISLGNQASRFLQILFHLRVTAPESLWYEHHAVKKAIANY